MKSNKVQCREVRLYVLFFTAIALWPLALLFLLANEQIYEIMGYDIHNHTKYETLPNDIEYNLLPNKMEIMEQRMEKRRNDLAQKCSQYGLDVPGNGSLHKANSFEFLVNRKYHLIWCNVFKAASTSWMHNFNVLAGYTPEFLQTSHEEHIDLARKKYPRVTIDELQEAQNDSITFIIARHPFERLLSAYRDKFEAAIPSSFYYKLGFEMVQKYRKYVTKKPTMTYPFFDEFVSWLLDEVDQNKDIDCHLVPATTFCTPCLIDFNIIAKFETLEEDQPYLIEKAGLQNIVMPEWKNSGQGKKTFELLQTYYSEITKKQLDGLYNYFRYDFEVFGYSPELYYNIVENAAQYTTEDIKPY